MRYLSLERNPTPSEKMNPPKARYCVLAVRLRSHSHRWDGENENTSQLRLLAKQTQAELRRPMHRSSTPFKALTQTTRDLHGRCGSAASDYVDLLPSDPLPLDDSIRTGHRQPVSDSVSVRHFVLCLHRRPRDMPRSPATSFHPFFSCAQKSSSLPYVGCPLLFTIWTSAEGGKALYLTLVVIRSMLETAAEEELSENI